MDNNTGIYIDIEDICLQVIILKTKLYQLSLHDLSADISSQSVALDKFIDLYNNYKLVLNSYIELLENDLQNIQNAVNEMESIDINQAQSISLENSLIIPQIPPMNE